MKAILLFSEDEDVDQGDDDLDSLAAINRALNSVGISNLDLNQGQGNTDASKRRRGNHSRPIEQNQRKTRLTWELHPILLLHDLMPALEAEDHEHYVSEEEEDEPILDISQAHGTEKENWGSFPCTILRAEGEECCVVSCRNHGRGIDHNV